MSLGNHLRTHKRTQNFVVLAGCFVVLLSILFPFQSAFAKDAFGKEITSSDTEIKKAHSPDQLPFSPSPFETSSLNEGESTDDSDDEFNKLYEQLGAQATEELHSEKHIFVQLRTLIENRTTVSRFILYHCWRSFPAELA
jgi:hypothetical protein